MNESSQASKPTLNTMVQNIWIDLYDALAKMPIFEKGFHIFWLLGPFILLIERTPADMWLSLLALFVSSWVLALVASPKSKDS